jgi:hypothetical protein
LNRHISKSDQKRKPLEDCIEEEKEYEYTEPIDDEIHPQDTMGSHRSNNMNRMNQETGNPHQISNEDF